jgi:hypothetical protein
MRIEFYQGGWWYVKGRVWHHICWLEESRVASKQNRRRGGAGIGGRQVRGRAAPIETARSS